MAPAYTALTTAFFRGADTDHGLRDSIFSDITHLFGAPLTAAQPPAEPEQLSIEHPTIMTADPAPAPAFDWARTDAPLAAGSGSGGAKRGSLAGTGTPSGTPGTSTGAPTGTGSRWDSPERLKEPAATLAVGSVLRGRYELEAELGRGGMGVVYKAVDHATADERKSYVAIKVLSEDFKRHPLAIKSLAREAKKALKLAHPNVVSVYNFTRDGGNVFMVMELLEGRSLDQVLKTEGSSGLPRERVSEILQSLSDALSYAHQQGIVHADFKPSNAFLTKEGVVKVLDFGIARAVQTPAHVDDKTLFDVSQLHAISPAYASLEMHNNAPPAPSDDVYSLACVAYELLTGRHPFQRIDAAKAREAKLVPAPIRGLPRAQWSAIRRGLAFERADRIATIAEFIAPFKVRTRSRTWVAVLAGVALVAVAAAVIVPRQLESYRARQQAAVIATPGFPDMQGAIAQLQAAPASFRDRVLIDKGAREAILGYYQKQIADLTTPPNIKFSQARAKVDELTHLLPDSSAVLAMSQALAQQRAQELARLEDLRDRAIERSVLIPEQGLDDLRDVLAQLKQIDPSHKTLTDPSIPKIYYAAAKYALDTNHTDLAHSLLVAGVGIAPNDTALLDLQDAVEREVTRIANSKRQAELEQRLALLNPASPDFLDKVLEQREDLTALAGLAPDSPVIKRIESSLGNVVTIRIKQRLAAEDVAGAQSLMRNIGEFLPDAAANSERDLIVQAAAVNQSKAFVTLEQLRKAVLGGRLGKTGTTGAQDLYAQLQRAGSSSDVLADARDYLAYGYLKDARAARVAGDRQRAAAQLTVARDFQPSATIQSMLVGEQQQLDAATPGADSKAEIDAARGRFAQSLRSPTLGPAELSTIALALDRLDSLGASAQEIASGIGQVEDRVLQDVQRLRLQPGADPEQLAEQAAILLPESDRLAATTKAFREADAATGMKATLDALLRQPAANDQWAGQVKDLTQKIRALVPANDPQLADARRIAAATFVKAASDARVAKRADEQKRYLSTAREFDPDARLPTDTPAAQAEVKERIAKRDAEESAAAELANQAALDSQRSAAIDALKERLASQAQAGDIVSAAKTANALRTVLAGNIYTVRDLPQTMISAYVQHAKNQFASGKVSDALQTLAMGAQAYGDSPDIRMLQARYNQAKTDTAPATSTSTATP